ncbi:MAG: PAS domain S-box protein [Gammaproteobacteria bacterium]|nr:PAS domain S-box protein [Gammaproteobacteria bacterium]
MTMGLRWPGRLRYRFMLATLLPITLIFVSMLVWQLVDGRQRAEEEYSHRVQRKAEESAQRLNSLLYRLMQDARQIAAELGEQPALQGPALLARLRLQLMHAEDPLFGLAVAFVPEADGALHAPYVHRAPTGVVMQDRAARGFDYTRERVAWYREVFTQARPYWSEPYFERDAGERLMVTYAHPVFRDGRLVAVVAANIDISELSAPLGLAADEFIVTTADGQYIYHPDALRIMNENLRADRQFADDLEFVTAALGTRSGFRVVATDQQAVWVGHALVTLPDWRIAILLPQAVVYQRVDAQTWVNLATFGLLVVLTGLAVFLAASRVARPLEGLRQAVDALTEGHWEVAIPVKGSKELQRLAQTLRNMAQELRQRQESLLDARGERFAALLEGLGHNFFYFQLSPAGQVLAVTPSVVQILGYSPDEFRRRYQRLYTANGLNDINLTYTEQALAGQVSPMHMVELLHADGSAHQLQMALRPITAQGHQVLAIEALVTDVTELTYAARWFRTLLEATPDAMVICDQHGRIEYINHQAGALFGRASDALVGLTFLDLLAPEPASAAWRALRGALEDPQKARHTSGLELQGLRPDGGLFPMEVSWASAPARREDEIQLLIAMRDISDKKQISLQIERAKLRLQDIADSIPGAVFQVEWDASGELIIHFLSNGVEQTHGVPRPLVMNRPGLLLDGLSPPHRTRLLQGLRDAQAERIEEQVRIVHPDGQVLWLQCNARARVLDGGLRVWNGYWVDITHHKQVEEELKRSETFFRTVFDQADAGIVSADARGNILRANPAFATLIGCDQTALANMNMLELSAPEDQPETLRLLREVQAGELDHFQQEKRFLRQDGDLRWGHLRFTALRDETGTLVESISIIHDVTEQRAIADALAEAKDAADQANRAKSEFLANLSHEIRTPMNAIIGLTHLCQQTTLDLQQQGYLGKIDNAAQTLLGIINDVLDFSKIEAGKLELECIEFELEEVLERISDLFTFRAGEKGVELVFAVEPNVPARLIGDPLRLSQILINFVSNAIKFTERGEIVLSVRLQGRADGRTSLYFSVRDSGLGITAEQQQRLFRSFSQADGSTTRRFGGTGLGLAICKRLVELMDGEIGVSSEAGRGSTFYFSAWFGEVAGGDPLAGSSMPELQGLRVLVVDDNDTTRETLRDILEAFDFRVQLAASGDEALRILSADAEPVRLILMDWRMPGLDGVETARRIRAQFQAETPVIIMVSAYDHSQIQATAQAAGVRYFLPKPLSPSLLLDAILRALGQGVRRQRGGRHAGLLLSAPQREVLARKRVLLVEDNEINQEVAQGLLGELGLSVTVADDGRQGVDKALGGAFDLILMDCQMPVMDGYAATREIRDRLGEQAPPIVAMTANVLAGDREACLAAGMVDHVGKPIDVPELHRVLWRWLGDNSLPHTLEDAAAGQAPDPQLWPDAQVIDAARGLRLMGEDAPRYAKLLQRFAEQQADAMQRLHAALESNDQAQAVRIAHTLKGLAGSLGATTLQTAAAQLEADLQDHGLAAGGGPGIAMLEDAFQAVLSALSAWQRTEAAGSSQAPLAESIADPVLQAELLDALQALLDEDDGEAMTLMLRIRREAPHGLPEDRLNRLQRAIDQYDFEAARDALASLRETPPV